MGGCVRHQGCLKAGLSAVALCAAFAANAAPTSVAPACTASLTQPSWTDCAGALSGDGRFDSAIDDPIYLEADGAPNASIDFTSVGVNIPGGGASQAPMRATSTVAAIPEPHTSLLMLAGLAAIGFMAMRRRRP
jgi:PEP-CTERM motif